MQTSKPGIHLVVISLLLAGGIYAALSVGLNRLAHWAESEFEAYPYLAGEETLRLLLPSIHGSTDRGTLLLGSSAIGEAFLYEELERAWGERVRSGGISFATLDELYLFLSYIEQAHGAETLPRRVILGMKPRLLANHPRRFGPRMSDDTNDYFIELIDRYSPEFSVARNDFGSELVAKTPLQSFSSRLRFYITKQQPRHKTAMLAAVEHMFDPDPLKTGFQERIADFPENPRTPLESENIQTTATFMREQGVNDATRLWLRAYRTAYTNMFMRAWDDNAIRRSLVGAILAVDWAPDDERELVSKQLDRLESFASKHGVELVIVYLPVHSIARDSYNIEYLPRHRAANDEHLPNIRTIDMWDAIPDELFFDKFHLKYEGARRATTMLLEAIAER